MSLGDGGVGLEIGAAESGEFRGARRAAAAKAVGGLQVLALDFPQAGAKELVRGDHVFGPRCDKSGLPGRDVLGDDGVVEGAEHLWRRQWSSA